MGLLDRLFRGRRPQDAQEARPLTADEALARWRHLVGSAPVEALAEAHARGIDSLEDLARSEALQRLRAGLSALEPGMVVPTDAGVLVRSAARAERRAPGFLERALAGDVRGRQTLSGIAAAVVTTSAAAPYLRGFVAAVAGEPLPDRRTQELDVDVPGSAHSSDHDQDHDLDDED
jgi:hypothetical protein